MARQVLQYERTIGIVAMEGRGFSNPVDIAFSSDDRIYVVSRTNSLQPYGIRIGICDVESNYYGDFGSYGSDPGQFVWPSAVAFDQEDNLYLVDEHNHRITVFDTDGGYIRHWGEQGSGDGQIDGPSGIALEASGVRACQRRLQLSRPEVHVGRRVRVELRPSWGRAWRVQHAVGRHA